MPMDLSGPVRRHPTTPEDLHDFGYTIHVGGADDEQLHDKFWWTWCDPITGAGVLVSPGDWPTEQQAIDDARQFKKDND